MRASGADKDRRGIEMIGIIAAIDIMGYSREKRPKEAVDRC